MKKIIPVLCTLIVVLSGCDGVLVDTDSGQSSEQGKLSAELESSYDFYSETIETIMSEMDVDINRANAIFCILLDCGIDDEVNYIFKKDGYYDVWAGLIRLNVYLDDNGSVSKIFASDEQIYPVESHNDALPDIWDKIYWKDGEDYGIVNLRLDGTLFKETIISNYYIGISEFIKNMDASSLEKGYEYLEFVGNVVKDDKIECTIKGRLPISYILETPQATLADLESNIENLFVPEPLQ